MDFTNTPRDVRPGRPAAAGPRPSMPVRRVFSDFAPRPATAMPGPAHKPASTHPIATHAPATVPAVAHTAARPIPPQQSPLGPATHTAARATSHPTAHPQAFGQPTAASRPSPAQPPIATSPLRFGKEKEATAHKQSHSGARSGLVGFICFVVFAGLLLSPFLPGKILENFPGSSDTISTGQETLACLEELSNANTATAYDSKAGWPITYHYATTTTESAACQGKPQSAAIGSASQFNPLGLVIDTLLALVAAIGIAKVWGIIAARRA